MKEDRSKNEASTDPELDELHSELADILEDAARNLRRRDDFDDVRFCKWPGQSDDGRKHEADIGEKPMPWENASDVRIRLADRIVNEHVQLSLESFFRANMRVTGVEHNDNKKAAYWRDVLAYFLEQRMLPELRREVEILAQNIYAGSPGLGVLGVYWQREVIQQMKVLTVQEVQQMVFSMGGDDQAVQEVMSMFLDPDMEEKVLPLISQLFPGAKPKALKKALKEFRETGQAELPVPTIHENRPKFVAHRLYEDIFIDSNCTELDRARVIIRRDWYTETELREKVVSEGWDEGFVEEVIEKAEGQSGVAEYDYRNPINIGMLQQGRGVSGDYDNLFEVFHAYRRQFDPDTNVPGIYCTIFSSHVKESYGKHELVSYGHNQMPFVLFSRERLSRSIYDSRGIPEIVQTSQYEVKVQRDLRNDASQISVVPPLLVHARRGGLNLLVAPGSQMTISRPDDIGWLAPPPPAQGSIEAELAANSDAEKYFGGDGEDAESRLVYRQSVINRWLDSWREALDQALCLCMQYLPPQFASRLTGAPEEEVMVSREDISGKYDLSLRFSADLLNPEFMEKKLDAVTKLTQFDVTGALDRNKLLQYIAESIDPQLASQVIMDAQSAAQKEIEEEQSAWIKIANEIEPLPKEGVNFQVRLQTAQQIMQTSGELQKKLQESPLIQQLAQNRMKYLEFGIAQQENAQIGRVGVKQITGGQQ